MDRVETKQRNVVHVLFVAEEDNTIRKIVVSQDNPTSTTTCLLEILQPIPRNSSNRIINLQFLKKTVSIIFF